MIRVCHSFLSVQCSLVVTCWKGLTSWLPCVWRFVAFCHFPVWCPWLGGVLDCIDSRPRVYKTRVHSQTQNKAQWLTAGGHASASNLLLRLFWVWDCTQFYNLWAWSLPPYLLCLTSIGKSFPYGRRQKWVINAVESSSCQNGSWDYEYNVYCTLMQNPLNGELKMRDKVEISMC